jgi:hypothetical protein
MGQHAIKERKEAAKARKRNAQTTSSTSTASDDSRPVSVATHVTPVTEGKTTISAAVKEQPRRGRQTKSAEVTISARTTRSRSASTSKSTQVNVVDSIGTVSQAQSQSSLMATSSSDKASERARPVRKASTAVRTLLHRIALSNITEQSGSESSQEDQVGSEEEYEEDDGSANVTDEVEVLEEIIEVRPRKTKAERMRTSAMLRKAMRDTPTEESEAEDDEDGEYITIHSNH